MNTCSSDDYYYSSGITPLGGIALFFVLLGLAWMIAG